MNQRFKSRTTIQYGLEREAMLRLQELAKRLHIHPGWLVMQMTNLFNERPDVLFDYLSRKVKE